MANLVPTEFGKQFILSDEFVQQTLQVAAERPRMRLETVAGTQAVFWLLSKSESDHTGAWVSPKAFTQFCDENWDLVLTGINRVVQVAAIAETAASA